MSYSTFVWGGDTVSPNPDIDGVEHDADEIIGSQKRMLSGKLRVDAVARKRRTMCKWTNRTKADRDALEALWVEHAHVESSVTFPDGVSYTALAYANGFRCSPWFSGQGTGATPIYNITITFEEV